MKSLAELKIDPSTISQQGIALMGFQRTKQISRQSRLSWTAGDPGPLNEEARTRRDEIFQGTLQEIHSEYLPLHAFLTANDITPKSVVDIGCGQAINDIFLYRDYRCKITLVDIEETPAQYHDWNTDGSGYASLSDAVNFLRTNKVPASKLVAFNPREAPERVGKLGADLVTSLYSCGFHYPVDEYTDLFCKVIEAGGSVVLDFRARYLRQNTGELPRLLAAGTPHVIFEDPKSRRILIRK